MRFTASLIVVLGLFGLAEAAGAKTDWPSFQSGLAPGQSNSPRLAEFPAEFLVVPPVAEVPRKQAVFSGLWKGWLCRGATFDARLVVERIGQGSATLVFAGASADRPPFFERVIARFEDGELLSDLAIGSRLTLAARADGHLNVKLESTLDPNRWCTGILAMTAADPTWRPPGQVIRPTSEMLKTELVEDGAPVHLEVVIHRPVGKGPFPLLVFNHGSTGHGKSQARFRRTWWNQTVGRLFAGNGWMVAAPQRRGRGKSDGLYDEGFSATRSLGYSSDPVRALQGAERALTDVAAVIDVLLRRPEVDPTRLVIGGQSRGGILSVAYAGRHPKQVRGVINFVGGWLAGWSSTAIEVNGTLARAGAAFDRPMLWLYGARDPYYSLDHSRAVFGAFRTEDGRGAYHAFDLPRESGHNLIDWPDQWQGLVVDYLQALDLAFPAD